MSGHANQLTPSIPVAGAGRALTAKRSVRLLDPQGGGVHSPSASPPASSQTYDPPRAPRAGFEWVWFPAGYWAERELIEMSSRKPDASTWPFRWNKRSVKESIGGWAQESSEDSTREPVESPLSPPLLTPKSRQMPPLASPFLSEAAHVQSLQYPNISRMSSDASESSSYVLNMTEGKQSAPSTTPWPSGTADDPPNQPPKHRRSYFQLRGSGDGTSPPAFTASNRLTSQPSLSPKTSGVGRVRPLRGPSPGYFGKHSNESFGSGTISDGGEKAPGGPTLSTTRSSTGIEPATQQLKAQTQASEARHSSPLGKGPDDAKPKQSFMKRLMWDSYSAKKPDLQSHTIAIIIEEAKSQPHDTQPPAPNSKVSPKHQDDDKGDISSISRTRKLFGRSAKGQRESVSSSIGASGSSLLRGRTLEVTTPKAEHDSYFITSEVYPGGEARRVPTPPIREAKSDGRPRSFFFDISAPPSPGSVQDISHGRMQQKPQHYQNAHPDHEYSDGLPYSGGQKQSPTSNPLTPHSPASSRAKRLSQDSVISNARPGTLTRHGTDRSPQKGLWAALAATGLPPPPNSLNLTQTQTQTQQQRTTAQANNANHKHCCQKKDWRKVPVSARSYEGMAPGAFAFDLPEHLPSSPMCPANNKHVSGGTGVCVYHGRRKRSNGTGGTSLEGGKESSSGNYDENDGSGVSGSGGVEESNSSGAGGVGTN